MLAERHQVTSELQLQAIRKRAGREERLLDGDLLDVVDAEKDIASKVGVHRGLKGPSITLSRSHPGLVRRLFELTETDDVATATEELLRHSAEDVVFYPHVAHGRAVRGHDALREFWSRFADEGREIRAGVYSITEEGDSVVVTGWVRTMEEGRLADTQSRWVYRFNSEDLVVSARVERA